MGRAEELFEQLSNGGESVIDQMIADRQAEELFLDFKRSTDEGAGPRLHQRDRNNLAKAISGFGNSEGGVIVWGVDCRDVGGTGDVARAKFPLADPARYVSWLQGAVSGCTLPAHTGVEHRAVYSQSGRGYVLTLVPKSFLAPHQAVGVLQYYMRAGSDFLPVPHGVLQGMFGRPPQPTMFHMWSVGPAQIYPVIGDPVGAEFKIGVILTNRGPGIARDAFLNVAVWAPDGPSEATYSFPAAADWQGGIIMGNRAQIIAKDHMKLAPEALVTPVVIGIRLTGPFLSPFDFEITYGHGGSPTTKIHGKTPETALAAGFAATVLRRDEDGARTFLQSLFQP